MIAQHINQQLDRLYFETTRLAQKAAKGESFDPFADFEQLRQIRNSLVFLKNAVAENDFEPSACKIAISKEGNAYPVSKQ